MIHQTSKDHSVRDKREGTLFDLPSVVWNLTNAIRREKKKRRELPRLLSREIVERGKIPRRETFLVKMDQARKLLWAPKKIGRKRGGRTNRFTPSIEEDQKKGPRRDE